MEYCQYLLVSQINYTLTNYAEHTAKFSHDMANRYFGGDEIRPSLVWENICQQVYQAPYGFVVFDDTVIDKNFSHHIELVRSQVKHDLLDDHLRQQLKSPTVQMCLA